MASGRGDPGLRREGGGMSARSVAYDELLGIVKLSGCLWLEHLYFARQSQ
jgi:hypothetical protein